MTSIEWTDETWNPVTGCDRCSPGCDNCYALTLARRLKAMGSAHYQVDGDPRTSGPGFGVQCHQDALDIPLRWRSPRRVFVNSMSDLFHPDVPDHFIARVFGVMALRPQHTFQILTKRPQRMRALLSSVEDHGNHWSLAGVCCVGAWPLHNVWLGTSIESDRYTWRADRLRDTPAAVRFISAEPLLGPLPSLNLTGIDWLIVGGESGPGARPMHGDWPRALRDRCMCHCDNVIRCECDPAPSGTAFFFKQWGAWAPGSYPSYNHSTLRGNVVLDDGRVLPWEHRLLERDLRELGMSADEMQRRHPEVMTKVGKKAAGRVLDGRTWDEYPKAVTAA